MPLYDYKCLKCNHVSEVIRNLSITMYNCDKCGGKAERIFSPTNVKFVGDSNTSFNAHYDLQLGKWFESAEHKKKFLNDTGRVQISGPLSPRKASKSLELCSKSQALRREGYTAITRKKDNKYVNRVSGNTHT